MSRRIVVGLDGSEYTTTATRVACQAVKTFGGTVIGVAVVDTPGIEASSRGAGIGAYEYARRAREQKLNDAEKHARAYLETFEKQCTESGAAFELAYRDGVPFQAIIDEARCADLIVVGFRTFFHRETRSEPGDTVRRLMETGVCPVVAVPKNYDPPQRAIIAYDGSVQAARAMREYVLLTSPSPQTRKITLIYVGQGIAEDKQVQIDDARRYIAGYGFEVQVERHQGQASRVIHDVAAEQAPCIVIMGAYGRQGIIKQLFFGSTAKNLIESECVPLFVYH
jgi:nucleotide-binding universal stress UspA family protein